MSKETGLADCGFNNLEGFWILIYRSAVLSLPPGGSGDSGSTGVFCVGCTGRVRDKYDERRIVNVLELWYFDGEWSALGVTSMAPGGLLIPPSDRNHWKDSYTAWRLAARECSARQCWENNDAGRALAPNGGLNIARQSGPVLPSSAGCCAKRLRCREVHIQLLSRGDTSEVGSYVPCSRLRDAMCGKVRGWWITCVGLRAGRSVEQDYERGGYKALGLSSPFLFVYGDDRVIRYTGAYVDTSGAEDVQRLAAELEPPSDSYKNSEVLERVAPDDEGGPIRRCLQVNVLRGAWRLVVRVPCQAVWKQVSLGGSRAALSDNTVAIVLITLICMVYKALGDTSKCECACGGSYRWVQIDCPPQYVADEFGSLGTLRTLFVLGTPLGVTEYGL
ncbi:hypothetical protein DEO72_LG11g1858 [Vigna unguiculata]|uniref:Uncharacterized protein n=1 Tax=Vigna unguiculata TaxID=3917 RepID=A0A4D6NPB2_VIGUN|nr:hypothetical protein DEO72_LG11g1858 [Vigna unguiculata]